MPNMNILGQEMNEELVFFLHSLDKYFAKYEHHGLKIKESALQAIRQILLAVNLTFDSKV